MTRQHSCTGRRLAAIAFACVVSVACAALAEETPNEPTFGAEELEQIVAPIALYPDALLSQVFMASTYPLEVVEAARFVGENPELKDDALNQALKEKTWDASVKSLVSFPQVLTMMNEKLDWTQKLGDAFLAQQKDVMNAVQRLRAKAHEQGNLESNEQQKVIVEQAAPTEVHVQQAPTQVVVEQAPPTVIKIEQANPQVVYVPAYNPVVVYGPWPYPAYPPYYYYPPGYIAGSALWFGAGMAVGAAIWGDCDWNNGDVDINVSEKNEFNRNTNIDRGDRGEGGRGDGERGDRGRDDKRRDDRGRDNKQADRGRQGDGGGKSKWNHDPSHRKGVQYRDKGSQQKYDRGGPKGADSREAFRGRAEQGRQQIARDGAGTVQRDVDRANAGARDRAGSTARDRAGDSQRSANDRAGSTTRDRSGQPQRSAGDRSGSSRDRSSYGGGDRSRGSDAFKGVGSGSQTRRDSSRGHSSRSSASRGGYGGGSRGGGGFGGGGGRGGGGGGRRR
jgi:hypothetical protein